MTTTEVAEVFDVIRPALQEIVRGAPQIDASFLEVPFDHDRQRELANRMIATVGLEDDAWRLDTSAHPFCISFARQRRAHDDALHGHRLARALVVAARGRPRAVRERERAVARADAACRLAVASGSTSRRAGRGRTSSAAAGRSGRTGTARSRRRSRTELGDVGLDAFMAAINRAHPTALRGQADETTYSLHIILRFDLERQLVEERLDAADLPRPGTRRCRSSSAWRCRTTRTASSRTRTGRAARSATSRPTRSAT